jgi:hypothetical protein
MLIIGGQFSLYSLFSAICENNDFTSGLFMTLAFSNFFSMSTGSKILQKFLLMSSACLFAFLLVLARIFALSVTSSLLAIAAFVSAVFYGVVNSTMAEKDERRLFALMQLVLSSR